MERAKVTLLATCWFMDKLFTKANLCSNWALLDFVLIHWNGGCNCVVCFIILSLRVLSTTTFQERLGRIASYVEEGACKGRKFFRSVWEQLTTVNCFWLTLPILGSTGWPPCPGHSAHCLWCRQERRPVEWGYISVFIHLKQPEYTQILSRQYVMFEHWSCSLPSRKKVKVISQQF